MFTGQQSAVRFFRTGQRMSQQAGGLGRWLLIAPGLIIGPLRSWRSCCGRSCWPIWWRGYSLRSDSASRAGAGGSPGGERNAAAGWQVIDEY